MALSRLLVVALVAAGLVTAPARADKIPEAVKTALEKADQFELISLDPSERDKPADGGFHGWKVLGKTLVKDKDGRKKVLDALAKGVADNKGEAAKCFIPRHGLRVVHDKKTYDLVICF